MFGLGNVGPSGLILILVALLFVFGPRKLPEIGRGFGKALREFRRTTNGLGEENEENQMPTNPEVQSSARQDQDELRGKQD